MPKRIKLSAPALPSFQAVSNRTVTPSDNESTNSQRNMQKRKHPFRRDKHSSLKDPDVPTPRSPTKPDTDSVSEYNETDNGENDELDAVQSNDEDNDQSIKSSRVKQNYHSSTLSRPRKRKAGPSGGKASEQGISQPAIKKQKLDKPATKRDRKATNSQPNTAKARFLAASAVDTRPLPWGEPEVWAEVSIFPQMDVDSQS